MSTTSSSWIGRPKFDRVELLRELRARDRRYVLVLTARDKLNHRVQGLDQGADDYVTKPFDLPELEARVRALIGAGTRAPGRFDISVQMAFASWKFRHRLEGMP